MYMYLIYGLIKNNNVIKTIDGLPKVKESKPCRIYNDTFDKTFKSLMEAERELGFDHSNLSKVAQGKRKKHKGFNVEYI